MKTLPMLLGALVVVVWNAITPITPLGAQPIAQPKDKDKPTIAVIATGGTIAGTAASPSQAAYRPAQLAVETLLAAVPQLEDVAQLQGIQLSNIASQAMNHCVWLQLAQCIDSLLTAGYDAVVVTHGSDTMEETAYFLQLTVPHTNPVVLVGAMRPANGLGADGPMNLYNAVCLAASPQAHGKGVMLVMNDYIYSADDVVKVNTVNPNAFACPNYGPLGTMRNGIPCFYREPMARHTAESRFSIRKVQQMPVAQWPYVEILVSYANAEGKLAQAALDQGAEGLVLAGVGHGNTSPALWSVLEQAISQGVCVVRSTRVLAGGVTTALEDNREGQVAAYYKSPQRARILLMLALMQTRDFGEIQEIFRTY